MSWLCIIACGSLFYLSDRMFCGIEPSSHPHMVLNDALNPKSMVLNDALNP